MIEIYTDGSSRGNPGNGGWAAILRSGKHYKEISGGFACTTNNRMELLAVIEALAAIKIKRANVKVWSDSQYVCNAINKGWLFDWEKKGLEKKKNPDLWRRFLTQYRKHTVQFFWIKGHSGHPFNERCDTLAVEAAQKSNLPIDQGYMECNPDSLTKDQSLPL